MALDSAYRTSSRAKNEEHDPRGFVVGNTTIVNGAFDRFAFAFVVLKVAANDIVTAMLLDDNPSFSSSIALPMGVCCAFLVAFV
jgi:hypothetical protein